MTEVPTSVTPSDPAHCSPKFPIKNRHFVWVILVLALSHFSQLSAKNDDNGVSWVPPIEPPGSIVVTTQSEKTTLEEPGIDTKQALAEASNSTEITTKTPSPQAHGASEANLRLALTQWSKAWQQQNMAQYLSMYADNFKAPNGISREVWAQQRTQRITSKKTIQHSINDLQIDLRAVTATVRFTQHYQDERLNLTDFKTMFWAFKDGRWQITLETTR